jgi:site-specific DNA-methyltransferase (adenine-specific)
VIDLRLGDCLDSVTGLASLADKSVDVVLTDPPYEAEAHEKGKRRGPGHGRGKKESGRAYARVVDESFNFDAITEYQRTQIAHHLDRIARQLALVFCQVEAVHLWRAAFADGDLVYRRTIPWVKPDAMPSLHGRWPGQAFEALTLFVRRGGTVPLGGKARYYEHTRERGDARAHPTAKPLELMLQIVRDFSRIGDLVCDPFAGSGTTGVACKMLGRRFIGWEMNAEYHAIATRRLNGDEAKPRPEQPSLFGGTP